MLARPLKSWPLASTLAASLALVTASTAAAAPPPNDVHPGIAIESLPFTHSADTTEAEIHAMELAPTCMVGGTNSVWYSFTPATEVTVVADTFGSDYDTVLDVRSGTLTDDRFDPGFEALSNVACNDDTNGPQSQLSFTATAGTTYFIRVVAKDVDGGSLQFRLAAGVPNTAMADGPNLTPLVAMLAILALVLSNVIPLRRKRGAPAQQ